GFTRLLELSLLNLPPPLRSLFVMLYRVVTAFCITLLVAFTLLLMAEDNPFRHSSGAFFKALVSFFNSFSSNCASIRIVPPGSRPGEGDVVHPGVFLYHCDGGVPPIDKDGLIGEGRTG